MHLSYADALAGRFRALGGRFRQHGFVRSVGVLVGGTAFGQAIMMVALPFLTRLYTPHDFSVLAVYASLLGIISVASCLRLEIAIPMPHEDEDGANVLALAFSAALAVSVMATLAVCFFPMQIVHLVKQPPLRPYLWLLPLGIFLTGAYNALQFWSTRKKTFSIVAKTRVSQALGGAGAQIGLGWLGYAPFGLLFGQMISSGAGIVGLGYRLLKDDSVAIRAITLTKMRRLLREYDRFPKYSTFESLANSAGILLPIILIAALATGPEAGFLMLAMRAMQAPMALIGSAVSQVYLSHAPQERRMGNLPRFTANIIGGLARAGVGPIVFAGIVAPVAFPIIFGGAWYRAGELVAWMTPWFVFQFLASPVSMTLHVTNNQRVALVLQVFGLIFRVGLVLLSATIAPKAIAEVFAISGFVFYAVYLGVVARLADIGLPVFVDALKPSLRTIAVWIVLGTLVHCALEYAFRR